MPCITYPPVKSAQIFLNELGRGVNTTKRMLGFFEMKENHNILTNSRKRQSDFTAMPLFIVQLKVFSIASETYHTP
jgi:hypothetical protein